MLDEMLESFSRAFSQAESALIIFCETPEGRLKLIKREFFKNVRAFTTHTYKIKYVAILLLSTSALISR